jgi:hypothetical protein
VGSLYGEHLYVNDYGTFTAALAEETHSASAWAAANRLFLHSEP